MKTKIIAVVLLASLLLTSCREKVDMYFYNNDSWRLKTSLTLMVDVDELGDRFAQYGLTVDVGEPDYGGPVVQYGQHEERNGIQVDWHRIGNTITQTAKGRNYAQFPSPASDMFLGGVI